MEPPHPPLTRSEARAADARAALDLGLPTATLMENAGRGLASVTQGEARRYGIGRCLVLGGRGNNGGDGFVAARHLLLRGMEVRVLLAAPRESFAPSSDPGRNLRTLEALGVPVLPAHDGDALGAATGSLGSGWVVVDAVLGTGLAGPVGGHLERVLGWMRECGRPVVAADLPSGLDADTGALLGPAPRCAATATFLWPKRGLYEGEGPAHAGRIHLCDIGVPPSAVRGDPPPGRGLRA